jgi:hypothetical protein
MSGFTILISGSSALLVLTIPGSAKKKLPDDLDSQLLKLDSEEYERNI